MVNEVLVDEGYASVATFPPDVKHQERFIAVQQQARDAGRGLWGPVCAPTPEPTVPPVIVQLTQPPPTQGDCDPAYPTVCIPPPPPDLDCGDSEDHEAFVRRVVKVSGARLIKEAAIADN
jgi:micrococcal nuclease